MENELDSGLRLWREMKGLTLTEVADLTGLSPSMLSRVESGSRELSPIRKVLVARRLGVRVGTLFRPKADDR